jgi:mandelamide amidase
MEDIILVDAAVNGYEPSKIKPTPLKGLRIGVPRYSFYDGLDLETARLTAEALKKLDGLILVEKDIADIDKLDRDVDFPMSLYECKRDFAAFFDPYGIKIEYVIAKIGSPDVKYSFDHFVLGKEAVTPEAYKEVVAKFRPIMLKAYEDYFAANKVDFIIIPTTATSAKPIAGSDESVEINGKKVPTFPACVKNTSPGSNVGAAGISLPIGLTKNRLPMGIEIDAKSGNNKALLGLALALSKVFGHAPAPKGY